MKTILAKVITVSTALLAISSARGQSNITDVVNGSVGPSNLKFADLTPDYRAMRIRVAGESSGGIFSNFGNVMLLSMGGNSQGKLNMPAMMQVSSLNDLFFTKGQTVQLSGHEFLVGYRLNTGPDLTTITSGQPKLAASLTLNLVRSDSVNSISPESTITPDLLRKQLSAAGVITDALPFKSEGNQDEAVETAIVAPIAIQSRTATLKTVCISNLKQIALGAIMYTGDHDDVFPKVQSTAEFQKLMFIYTKNNELWKDPNPRGGRYLFAMNLAGVSTDDIPSPAEQPMFYESVPWSDGTRAVAFVDGHVKRVNELLWKEIEPLLHHKFAIKPKVKH